MIVIEDYVDPSEIADAAEESGLIELVYEGALYAAADPAGDDRLGRPGADDGRERRRGRSDPVVSRGLRGPGRGDPLHVQRPARLTNPSPARVLWPDRAPADATVPDRPARSTPRRHEAVEHEEGECPRRVARPGARGASAFATSRPILIASTLRGRTFDVGAGAEHRLAARWRSRAGSTHFDLTFALAAPRPPVPLIQPFTSSARRRSSTTTSAAAPAPHSSVAPGTTSIHRPRYASLDREFFFDVDSRIARRRIAHGHRGSSGQPVAEGAPESAAPGSPAVRRSQQQPISTTATPAHAAQRRSASKQSADRQAARASSAHPARLVGLLTRSVGTRPTGHVVAEDSPSASPARRRAPSRGPGVSSSIGTLITLAVRR